MDWLDTIKKLLNFRSLPWTEVMDVIGDVLKAIAAKFAGQPQPAPASLAPMSVDDLAAAIRAELPAEGDTQAILGGDWFARVRPLLLELARKLLLGF